MNILIIRSSAANNSEYSGKHVSRIKRLSPSIRITVSDPDQKAVHKLLPQTDVILCSRYGFKDFLDLSLAQRLKWIHITSAGADNIIPFLKNSKVLLTNSSGVSPIPIAETVFGLMLMFARQIHLTHRYQILNKHWLRDYSAINLTELYGKTVAIAGFGRVGKRVAHIAKAFGMRVITLEFRRKISGPETDRTYPKGKFKTMLKAADFVINCLPKTPKTTALFSESAFKAMKPTAFFINVGVGQSVNEANLVKALSENLIAGAGLDVFETEPLPAKSPLWQMDNVIITPHLAGRTPVYTDRVVNIFIENLQCFLRNQPLPNLVDRKAGY